MKKQIPWGWLLALGIPAELIGRFFDGVIANSIGILGTLLILFGIIEFIRSIVRRRKQNQKTNL